MFFFGFRVQGLRFPKVRGTILGGPYNKDDGSLGPILGPPFLGNYHVQYSLSSSKGGYIGFRVLTPSRGLYRGMYLEYFGGY